MVILRPRAFGGVSASLVLLIDLGSKFWAQNLDALPSNNWFDIHLTYNKGIAFSMLPNQAILTNLTGLLFSVYLLYRISKSHLTRTSLLLGLVLGGVLGNLGERLVFGRVSDFIAIENFAVINLADVAIVFGLALYLIHLVKAPQLKR